MSKVLKTAAIVVGAVALVATGVGAVIGAAAAASTIVAAGASVATIASVASAAAAVLSVAASLTAKKPGATASGSQTSFSADPDDGLPLAIGRTGTAGKIGFRSGFDTRDAGDNDRQSFVSILSVGPIAAIEGQTVDRSPVSYLSTGAAIGAFAGFMWSMTQLGAMPEAAALGFGAGAGTPPGWTAAHKLSGLAAASWTLRFDTKAKLFQAGVPAPLWVVRGVPCYDPTKDSTYPGGSGPQRMADPADTAAYDSASATWTYTENPYLIALNWAHGFWQRDRSVSGSTYSRVMGIGSPWAAIDAAAFVEGRNIAEVNGWRAGGVIYSTDGKWDSMKRILQAGMGEPLALGARISCLVNAPKVSLATITIDDVVGPGSVGATQPRRDRINTITPRYRLEANNWQFLPGSPISVAEHVATDRGKRSRVQDYPFIQNTAQVATAVRYDIENAREFGPIVLPLKLVWMGYKPGDCVTATLPELGLNGQPILLLNRELGASTGIVTMTARSETAAKHAFALGQTTTPPPTAGVTGPLLVPVPGDGDWTLDVLPEGAGLVTPTLVVTGAARANVDSVVFEYRVFDSGGPWSMAGSDAPTVTRREIAGVLSATQYEVAVSYSRQGFVGDRRIIGPVTTPVTDLSVAWPDVTDPTGTKPEDNATYGAPALSPVADRTAGDVVSAIDIQVNAILAQALRQDDLDQVFDARTLIDGQPLGASFLSFRNTQIATNQVLNSGLTLIGAKTADGTGWNLNLDTVFITAGQTLGQKFTEIGATMGSVTASVQILTQALVTPEGGFAKAVFSLTAGGQVRGLVATNTNGFGAIDFLFDSIVIRNPFTGAPILSVDATRNVVKATNLEVDTLKINTAVVPVRSIAGSTVTSPGSFTSVLSATVVMPVDGWVEATFFGRQGFSSGDQNWDYTLLINGASAAAVGGGRTQDGVPMQAAVQVAAGESTVVVQFRAHSSVALTTRSLFVKGFPWTE